MDLNLGFLRKIRKKEPKAIKLSIITKLEHVLKYNNKKYDLKNYLQYKMDICKKYFRDKNFSYFPIEEKTANKENYFGVILKNSKKSDNDFIKFKIFSDGKIVPVNYPKDSKYSFFCGKVVCFEGYNPDGNLIHAIKFKELPLQLPEKKLPISSKKEKLKYICSSGPFFKKGSDNLDELEILFDENADVFILLGPFTNKALFPDFSDDQNFDKNNSETKLIIYCPFTLFEKFVEKLIRLVERKLNEGKVVQVILIPSTEDLTISSVFPQDVNKEYHPNINLISNPCSFFINDVLFNICSYDMLMDLKIASFVNKSENFDLNENLVENFDKQLCITPGLPLNSVPMCFKGLKKTFINQKFDVFITKSKIKKFSVQNPDFLFVNVGSNPEDRDFYFEI